MLPLLFVACFSFQLAATALADPSGPFNSYLFAFFYGEAQRGGEAIAFAVSEGSEPDTWQVINNNKPVLNSTVGTGGVRDPTIVRARDGSRFWLLATDLKMENGGGDWVRASRTGSLDLVIWESLDLRHWSAPRLARVSSPNAGNTWAPDAVWDEARQSYLVSWSSSLYPDGDREHKTASHHQVLRSWTRDFVVFSKPETWIDKKTYSVIDTTVVQEKGVYYRFTKDERTKFIWQDTSPQLDAAGDWQVLAHDLGKGSQSRAEGPLVFPSLNTPGKWHMWLDEFGGQGYLPLETMDIATAMWKPSKGHRLPTKAHHGYVIPITDAERRKLLS